MEASEIIFWFGVFLALYGGKWFADKARKNNFKGYDDEGCGCDTTCTVDLKDEP